MKGCVIMSLKKMDFRKAFVVLFVLIFSVTAALPAISACAITDKSSRIEYSYSQNAFYCKPYIFDIAWNISDQTEKLYSSKKITLSDKVSMNVWYRDDLKTNMSDKNVVSVLSDVLNSIKADSPEFSKPAVLDIKNLGDASPEELIKRYYKDENIMYYAAVLPFADSKTQQAYLKKAYDEYSAGFFTVSLDTLENAGLTKKYLGKAYKDGQIAFFSICLDKLEDVLNDKDFSALVNTYAEKAYKDSTLAFFAVLSDRMDRDTVGAWFDRAAKDGKVAFASVFDDYWDDFDDYWADFDDAWNDFNDKWSSYENYVNSSDYAKYGLTYKDGHYFYNKEPVRYFLDVQRSDSSAKIATVETNPKGNVSIKIVRDKNGNITGVEKLTAKEIKKYFGDVEY